MFDFEKFCAAIILTWILALKREEVTVLLSLWVEVIKRKLLFTFGAVCSAVTEVLYHVLSIWMPHSVPLPGRNVFWRIAQKTILCVPFSRFPMVFSHFILSFGVQWDFCDIFFNKPAHLPLNSNGFWSFTA